MDLQSLKFFRTVAAEGSFSKAAQKLNYAQSNLSTKINRLENELGVSLFYRFSYGVKLTPKGEQLLGYATEMLNIAEESEKAMRDDGEVKGKLIIGSMQSTAMTLLPGLLAKYHSENPHVSLCVKTGTTEASLHAVLEHTLDGAFVAGPVRHPELEVKELHKEHLMLVSSVKLRSGKDIAEILNQPILVFPAGCTYRKILERWLDTEGIFVQQLIEFDSISGIIASVSAGLGISLLPENVVDTYVRSGALSSTEIPKEFSEVTTAFVYRKNEYMETGLKSFISSF